MQVEARASGTAAPAGRGVLKTEPQVVVIIQIRLA